MNKVVYLNDLFAIYSGFLTEDQKTIFKFYYEENLSLQEVADLRKVSKSFIGKTIKQIEKKLKDYENNLQLYNIKNVIAEVLQLTDIEEIKKKLQSINK